ncbi:MAG: aldo/keto reductase [Bacteroidales bacterium]|nr:aldo/keto reductase [Bacteroidales bacterium]
MNYITLNNGVKMPQLGLGTFLSTDEKQCIDAVNYALQAGYRMIDTAQAYGNEAFIGKALKNSDVKREDLFLVTKVWFKKYEDAYNSVLQSMKDLQTDYLDLVLLHWPFGNTYKAWRDLEKLYSEGKVRAIGVSNYNAARLIDLVEYNKIVPQVNQIETNIYAQQKENHKYMSELQVAHMGYAPLGQGRINDFYESEEIKTIAAKYGKTPQQIILRFQLQNGIIIIPKSVNKNRIEENINVFDFSLDEQDMNTLSSMDKAQPMIGNPENPALVIRSRSW